MKEFKIVNDVFKIETLFIVNCDSEEFVRRAERYGVKPKQIDGYVCGTVIKAEDNLFRIIWVEKFTKKPEHIANLIHELFHLTTIICQDKQIPIKANIETGECGDEAAAYLLEFYTIECLKKLKGR